MVAHSSAMAFPISWGVLLTIGMIPLAIGLVVVLPWLGYATWHLYTRTVVR